MWKCSLTASLILLVGAIVLIALPLVTRNEIKRRMKLLNGTTLFESWSSCRTGIVVEFYFFNVSNEGAFMNGSKPVLVQIGPYTYAQKTCKHTLESFPQNGTVRYADVNTFEFLPYRSVGLESDVLNVINIGYVAVASKIGYNKYVDGIVNMLIKHYYNSQLFLNKTVYEMIWGYEDPLLKFINNFLPVRTDIGLYSKKNGSSGSIFEVDDGVVDNSKLGQISTVNGHFNLSVWTTPQANSINGSDGSLFPPFVDEYSYVQVYSPDLCRSLHFYPTRKPERFFINSVPTTKFTLSRKTFLSPQDYPDNRGFCLDYPDCPKSGILDMRKCMNDAPIAISLPHFNGADRSYRESVVGMHPRPDMDISLFIEPQTGVILQVLQLIQVNAIVRRHQRFPELSRLPNVTFLPVGYINTSIYVTGSVAHDLLSMLIVPQTSISVASSLMVTGALVTLVVLTVTAVRHRCSAAVATTHAAVAMAGEGEENTPLVLQPDQSPACHNHAATEGDVC